MEISSTTTKRCERLYMRIDGSSAPEMQEHLETNLKRERYNPASTFTSSAFPATWRRSAPSDL